MGLKASKGVFLPLERYMVRQAMDDIVRHSCVRFVERTTQKDYVKIIFDGNRCYSHIGRVGGLQKLSLGFFCIKWWDRGTIYHELLHALGFFHEHNRPDRDRFVEIQWDNIKWGQLKNFEKRESSDVELFDVPYDIGSVMHYSPYAFAKFHYFSPTIKSRKKGYDFKRASKPSRIDYYKLNRLYQCQTSGPYYISLVGDTGPSASWLKTHGFDLESPSFQQSPHEPQSPLLRIQTGLDKEKPTLVTTQEVKSNKNRLLPKIPKSVAQANNTNILQNWPRPKQPSVTTRPLPATSFSLMTRPMTRFSTRAPGQVKNLSSIPPPPPPPPPRYHKRPPVTRRSNSFFTSNQPGPNTLTGSTIPSQIKVVPLMKRPSTQSSFRRPTRKQRVL